MSARLARSALNSTARRAQATASSSAARISRRTMASTSHGAAKSKDTAWIVGSLLIFGPAFLYLVSPSARKATHHVHNDKHDFPGLKSKDEHAEAASQAEPSTLKDDEGTVADVGSSIALAEASDTPKAAQLPEAQEQVHKASEAEESGDKAPAKSHEESSESPRVAKSGTFQEKGEEGPTDLAKAQESAQKGIAPKHAAEAKD